MRIGVLALQGDFEAHGKILESLGAAWSAVNTARQLDGVSGLVIPGGESSTMLKLLDLELEAGIEELHARGAPIYGTCAGVILLAREVLNPPQPSLGLLDAVVERNGYGRQMESSILRRGDPNVSGELVPDEMVFIRAPVIRSVGEGVRILASVDAHPVFVEQGNITATTFHPELSADNSIHRRFLEKISALPV
jgi:5'-phosphate synthase pdxT subunit